MDTNTYKVGDAYVMPQGVSFCAAMATLDGVTYACSRENGHDALLLGTDHLAAEQAPAQRGKPTTWSVIKTWKRQL